jgi:hypothetical protein
MLDTSSLEISLQDPPLDDKGHTACPFSIGLKISALTLNMMC